MWRFNDEQQMLRDTVQQLAREELAPRAAELDSAHAFPSDWFAAWGELGLFGMTVPEELGGAGLGDLAAVLAVEELARGCAASASVLATHLFQVVPAVVRFGSEDLQAELLENLATGAAIGAVAWSEKQAGCDLAALESRAVSDGDGWKLEGAKTSVAGAGVAQHLLVAAHTSSERRLESVGLFVVDCDGSGVSVDGSPVSLGLRAAGAATVTFRGATVEGSRRLGEASAIHAPIPALRASTDLGAAALALGIAQASLDQAIDYAKTRKTFNVPIAEHQAISFKIANMATDVRAARALVYETASSLETVGGHDGAAASAKLFATEAAERCAFEALQIFGGYGYSQEYPVERLYRDARMGTLNDGTSEMQRIAIAASTLGA